jgi:hypothetical protein
MQRVELPGRIITSTPGQELNTSAQEALLSHYSAFHLHDTLHVSMELRIIFTVFKKLLIISSYRALQSSKGTFDQYSFQIITINVFEL